MRMGNGEIKADIGERRIRMTDLIRGMSRKWEILVGGLLTLALIVLPTVQAASYWLDENGTSLTSGLVGYWKFSEGDDGSLINIQRLEIWKI